MNNESAFRLSLRNGSGRCCTEPQHLASMSHLDENNLLLRTIRKLELLEKQKIWPHGKRQLYADACGIVLLCSVYHHTEKKEWLERAEWVVKQVKSVLGRRVGYRNGESEDEWDAQYFHYLLKFAYALDTLGKYIPDYKKEAVQLIKDIHPYFYVPNQGFHWKMMFDLDGPYPGHDLSNIAPYQALALYRLFTADLCGGDFTKGPLQSEIQDAQKLVLQNFDNFHCVQDFRLGECLWISHFYPQETWSRVVRERSLKQLDKMWVNNTAFCRQEGHNDTTIAHCNFVISIGLQAVGTWMDRVDALNEHFETFKDESGGGEEGIHMDSLTHVLNCCSLFPGYFLKGFGE